MTKLVWGLLLVALVGCREEGSSVSTTPAIDTPRDVVDSIFPVEEEIRRFKAARSGAAVAELRGGSSTRDSLVHRFVTAIETNDSAAFRAMIMNAPEFIDLYYPSSLFSHAPYKQSPEINWFLLQQNSEKGIKRLLERYGGKPTNFRGYTCKVASRVEGPNQYWDDCLVRWSPAPGAPSPMRLFGSIIERNGQFKFVSYANDM